MPNSKCQNSISKNRLNDLKDPLIIAHRGTTFWSPEGTEPAYRWARNIGADYLELDVQITKDKKLVAFHDDNLYRITNCKTIYPAIKNPKINNFTLKELRSLDAGSWFNEKNPKRSNIQFKGLKILTLQDVVMIAEGYRIKRINNEPVKIIEEGLWDGNYHYEIDPYDNENRPGLYIETKHPKDEVELILKDELIKYGWNINSNKKDIKVNENKVKVANSDYRVILQSFSKESIVNLEKHLPNIPKCLLLWKPDFKGNLKQNIKKIIAFAHRYNVDIIGTSISGEPNNYNDLTTNWITHTIKKSNLKVHSYSFDTTPQMKKYKDRIHGFFTNRSALTINYLANDFKIDAQQILKDLGY